MTELRHYRADDLDVFLKKYRYVDSNNVTATTFRTSAKAGVTLATAHRYALVTCTNPDESVMAQWADRHLHTVRGSINIVLSPRCSFTTAPGIACIGMT